MRPIHAMSPIAAMAVYGVPEREVDALIPRGAMEHVPHRLLELLG
jgi:hypothetical protein